MSAVVRVKIPPGISFGVVMSRVRIWLKENKIRLWRYRSIDGHGIGFELDFDRESEARLFRAAFDLGKQRIGE